MRMGDGLHAVTVYVKITIKPFSRKWIHFLYK